MGEVKTAGRGWVAPVGLPSAAAIETVGRDAIVVDVGVVVKTSGRRRRRVLKIHDCKDAGGWRNFRLHGGHGTCNFHCGFFLWRDVALSPITIQGKELPKCQDSSLETTGVSQLAGRVRAN